MADVHVLPFDDLRAHEETRRCRCEPTLTQEDWDSDIVVVHNSADGRELVEQHGVQ